MLFHTKFKSSLPKPLSTVSCTSECSKEIAKHDPEVQAKGDKLKNSVLAQGSGAASSTANTCKAQPLTLKETAKNLAENPSAEKMGNSHITVHLENSDCIKAKSVLVTLRMLKYIIKKQEVKIRKKKV